MGELVYGSELSLFYKKEMKEKIDALKAANKRVPCLAVILVGNNPASLSYIKSKEKACSSIGMDSKFIHLDEEVGQIALENEIQKCNEDDSVDGILLQLPLPKGYDENRAIFKIDASKDVDGLHPLSVGKLYLGEKGFVPCTPRGCMAILEAMHCDIVGKNAVVIGRSKLVGTPIARLLQNANATVTICHSKTKNLKEVCKNADILICALGKPKMVNHEYIKQGAYVVDVGINRKEDGKLCGDVNTEDVLPYVTAVTPVPKGVGPMTVCMLLANTLDAYESRNL
mgnify:FL=1